MDIQTIRKLGQGAQGEIYLAKQNDQFYVLKVFSKEQLLKTNSQYHIYNELEVLQCISHPSIPRIHTYYQDLHNVYYLMEYIPGVNLSEYLVSVNQISVNHAAFYLYQITLILNYLHSNQIIYRDIKPQNMIIDKQGFLKFVDFGFSKKLKSSRTYTRCGTPHYMAPEIINNSGHSFQGDYWSLGITFYELLTGYLPFDSSDPMEIYNQIEKQDIKFPKCIDKQAKRVINELTNKDPQKRKLIQRNDKIFIKLDKEGIENQNTMTPYIPQI